MCAGSVTRAAWVPSRVRDGAYGGGVSLESIGHDASTRALDQQARVLDEMRSRTGILLAASALAASFLGESAFKHPSAIPAIAALATFVVIVAASVFILVPRRGKLTFSLSGTTIIESLYEFRGDEPEIRRRLTYESMRLWDRNDRELQPLFRAFRVAALALVIEVSTLVWLVSRGIPVSTMADDPRPDPPPRPSPPPPPPPIPNIGVPETHGGRPPRER
jgi:hypothetical protein